MRCPEKRIFKYNNIVRVKIKQLPQAGLHIRHTSFELNHERLLMLIDTCEIYTYKYLLTNATRFGLYSSRGIVPLSLKGNRLRTLGDCPRGRCAWTIPPCLQITQPGSSVVPVPFNSIPALFKVKTVATAT